MKTILVFLAFYRHQHRSCGTIFSIRSVGNSFKSCALSVALPVEDSGDCNISSIYILLHHWWKLNERSQQCLACCTIVPQGGYSLLLVQCKSYGPDDRPTSGGILYVLCQSPVFVYPSIYDEVKSQNKHSFDQTWC